MKATITTIALALALCLAAGAQTNTQAIDLRMVGTLQHKATVAKDRAWLASLASGLIASTVLFNDGKNTHQTQGDRFAAWCVLSAGVAVHIGLDLQGNKLNRKAARLLEGNPIE